jgi:hypothetical protein
MAIIQHLLVTSVSPLPFTHSAGMPMLWWWMPNILSSLHTSSYEMVAIMCLKLLHSFMMGKYTSLFSWLYSILLLSCCAIIVVLRVHWPMYIFFC